MPFIDLETGIRMHYRDDGHGKAILFVAGFGATVDTWNYQVLDLHDRFRTISVDLRGHGDSDKPCSSYTHDECAGTCARSCGRAMCGTSRSSAGPWARVWA